jgi:hypothetical protein
MNTQICDLVEAWKDELSQLKCQLIERGSTANSLEYNLMSCEALRLSCCINDLLELLVATPTQGE